MRQPAGLHVRQLKAALRKNALVKWRDKRTTLCELLSPLFLVSLLVAGYSFSKPVLFPALLAAAMRRLLE